ncbi:YccJ family protein, partial [Salmonella enterica subsp. enterica serovar Infantis]
ATAHRVGEWASLRNTSPEIAEAIFEVPPYDEKLADKIWDEGGDEVLITAFEKPDNDSLFWGEQIIERKNGEHKRPRLR